MAVGFMHNRASKKWLGMLKLFFGLALLVVLYIAVSYTYFINAYSSVSVLARSHVTRNVSDPNHGGSFLDAIRIISRGVPALVQEGDGMVAHYLKFGELLPYCGMTSPCPDEHFAVHIYTGKDHNDEPKLCIDGEYIMELGLNGAGRGFNMIVIDNATRIITNIYNFDTYEKGSPSLESTLKRLKDGNILILFTFDEATKKLSDRARNLLQHTGSSLIQNLQFRNSWYLITQIGIKGFSPFEDLHMVDSGSWAEPHNVRFCIPFQLEGRPIYPDPLPRENKARQKFCKKYKNMVNFCDYDVVNENFVIAPIAKDFPLSKAIFTTPIIVISGEDTRYLGMTLETIARQPGVNPNVVIVYYLSTHPEVAALADLFNFMSEEYSSVDNYCDKLFEAQRTTKLLFPDAKQMIFIDENVILAPDFISYMGQLLLVLEKDPNLEIVSAWNINGFTNVSKNVSSVYRGRTLLKLAFMVRDTFPIESTCQNGTWSTLMSLGVYDDLEALVPEVSRVLYIPPAPLQNGSVEKALFNETRVTNFEDEVSLQITHLSSNEYDEDLQRLLTSSVTLFANVSASENCIVSDVAGTNTSALNQNAKVLAIFFEQNSTCDYNVLHSLCQCFGLFYYESIPPQGLYKGTLRFTYQGRHVVLIGSASPFARQWQNYNKPLVSSI